MFGCTAEIPTIDAVNGPGAATIGCLVDENFGAGRSKGSFVVVKSAIELSFGRESGVDAGGPQEVECLCALVDQATPQVHGKSRIETGEAGHKVVFPDADGAFGRILTMIVGWDELELYVLGAHKLLERGAALVVQFLELGFETAVGQIGVEFGVGPQELLFGAVFDGFGEDCGGIVVVDDHDVLVASA